MPACNCVNLLYRFVAEAQEQADKHTECADVTAKIVEENVRLRALLRDVTELLPYAEHPEVAHVEHAKRLARRICQELSRSQGGC